MRTYHQGENWIEQPGAGHMATENASNTEPAGPLLVVFVVVALREFSKRASITRWRRHVIGATTAGALSNRTLPRQTRPADRRAARASRGPRTRAVPDGRVLPERLAMRDDPRTVVTDPHASYVGTELGERTLLPGRRRDSRRDPQQNLAGPNLVRKVTHPPRRKR